MNKIAVLADTHLLSETQERIRALMNETLSFPTEDTQPTFEELIKRTGDASAILVSPGTKITEAYLTACPLVKYIGICGTSKENVDTAATAKRGITLTNVVDYGDEPAAEFIFMQLVQLARGVGDYQWREYPTELMNKSVGIIGLGPLGKAIAHLALAYKMKVSYYSRTRKPDQEQLGIHYMDKDDLLRSSEIIIVSTPTNLVAINTEDFGLINANAVVVQASTGKCLSLEGFTNWIKRDGNFAIFDYSTGNESYEAYKDMLRVIFPKVIAGHSYETKLRLGDKVVANLDIFLATK